MKNNMLDWGAVANLAGEEAEMLFDADEAEYAEDYMKSVYCKDYREDGPADCCGANDADLENDNK